MKYQLKIRHIKLALVCMLWAGGTAAQTGSSKYGLVDVEITKEKKAKKIVASVEIKNPFPGGDSAWIASMEKSLNQNLRYKNGARPGKYMVSVAFIVSKDGSVSDTRCLNKPVGFGMEAEVMRAIKRRARWLPAQQGTTVKPYRTSSSTPPVGN